MALIEIRGLQYTYLEGTPFESTALRGVDLTVEEGELLGLVGSTHSGKSTLLQFINGLKVPRIGAVSVAGIETSARRADLFRLRQLVGMLFQYAETQLFCQTVGEDIEFGPKNYGVGKAELSNRVREAMDIVGLPSEYRTRDTYALSGGEKRRAAIAGVLSLKPRVLLLDEPIAGLDPRGRDEILAWIRDVRQREGLTILIASNSIQDVAPLLSRVVVMSEGVVIGDGPPERVLTDEALMRKGGLGSLPTVELMRALRALGHDVPLSVFSPAEAATVVARLASAVDARGIA
jgi:energy-coupling factor transport system ATP-binding protein